MATFMQPSPDGSTMTGAAKEDEPRGSALEVEIPGSVTPTGSPLVGSGSSARSSNWTPESRRGYVSVKKIQKVGLMAGKGAAMEQRHLVASSMQVVSKEAERLRAMQVATGGRFMHWQSLPL
jgi:hypothetical protein